MKEVFNFFEYRNAAVINVVYIRGRACSVEQQSNINQIQPRLRKMFFIRCCLIHLQILQTSAIYYRGPKTVSLSEKGTKRRIQKINQRNEDLHKLTPTSLHTKGGNPRLFVEFSFYRVYHGSHSPLWRNNRKKGKSAQYFFFRSHQTIPEIEGIPFLYIECIEEREEKGQTISRMFFKLSECIQRWRINKGYLSSKIFKCPPPEKKYSWNVQQ